MRYPLVISLFIVNIFARFSWASFDVVPITHSFSPSGNGAVASFTVKSFSEKRIPIQINIIPRTPDDLGNEELKTPDESDDQFQIFPSQFILKPKESQTVRITWVGNPKITTELSFRMITEELPVELPDPGVKVKKPMGRMTFLNRYIGSLYVTPVNAQSNLTIKGTKISDKKGDLLLEVENRGTAHQVIRAGALKFKSEGQTGAAKEHEIKIGNQSPLYNQNLLAGKKRKFNLPWPPEIPVGPIQVTFIPPKE